MLEFVTFHVNTGAFDPIHPNATLENSEYISMIEMMCASARLFHPDAIVTLLSNQTTNCGGFSEIGKLIRSSMNVQNLMLERTKLQLNYIKSNDFKRPIVLLDSDILINRPLSPIISRDYDVALTWRSSKNQPINGGFMILNNTRPEVTKNFFARYASLYEKKYQGQAGWWGDQLALRDSVGLSLSEYSSKIIVDSEGCRIFLLPCDRYNFSPENNFQGVASPLKSKFVLHFKGERKRFMKSFWTAWLSQRGTRSPWAHFSAWCERRWLLHQSAMEKNRGCNGPGK
jgi:hypothetical protein